MSETNEIPSVEVLSLNPGDILVYTTPNWLTQSTFANVKAQLTEMIPEGVNLAIMEGGSKFTVLRPMAEEAPVDGQ